MELSPSMADSISSSSESPSDRPLGDALLESDTQRHCPRAPRPLAQGQRSGASCRMVEGLAGATEARRGLAQAPLPLRGLSHTNPSDRLCRQAGTQQALNHCAVLVSRTL